MNKSKTPINKICVTCLSTMRNLTPLQSDYRLPILQILLSKSLDYNSQIPFNVCWECAAQLRFIYNFQIKAKSSIEILSGYLKGTKVLPEKGFSQLGKIILTNAMSQQCELNNEHTKINIKEEIDIKEEISCESDLVSKYDENLEESESSNNIKTKPISSIDTSKSYNITHTMFKSSDHGIISPNLAHVQNCKEASFKHILAYDNKIITDVIEKTAKKPVEDPLSSNTTLSDEVMAPTQDSRKSVCSESIYVEDSSQESSRSSNKTMFDKSFLQKVPRLTSVNYNNLTLTNMLSSNMSCSQFCTKESAAETCIDSNKQKPLRKNQIEVLNKDVLDSKDLSNLLSNVEKMELTRENSRAMIYYDFQSGLTQKQCVLVCEKDDGNKESEVVDMDSKHEYLKFKNSHIKSYGKDIVFEKRQISKEELKQLRVKESEDLKYLNKKYKCESCIIGFVTKQLYNAHMNTFHNKKRGGFSCAICLRRYTSKVYVLKHLKHSHYFKLKCPECGLELSVSSAKFHYEAEHGTKCVCQICNTNFRSNYERRLHTIEQHYKYKCSCEKKFLNESAYNRHNKICKSDKGVTTEIYKCEECHKTFNNIHAYRYHLNSGKHAPANAPTFICDYCNKEFSLKDSLRYHIENKHSTAKKLSCKLCSKTYQTQRLMKRHIAESHTIRLRNKICEICGSGFYTKGMLTNHMVVHTKARPYKCTVCPATFGFKGALYTHNKLKHKKGKGTRNKPHV